MTRDVREVVAESVAYAVCSRFGLDLSLRSVDEVADRLIQWVSTLLARDDLHVCAVSPAAVCGLCESDSMTNPLLMSHYTITVIYQDRIAPPASKQVDPSAVAA
jgi:hypothetical protein